MKKAEFSGIKDLQKWKEAKTFYELGIKSRDKIGYSRYKKRDAYVAYHRYEDMFYKSGFQFQECKKRKDYAWDFEKMTEEMSFE